MITVPGDITSSSGYFCFIDKESFPVGTLIPKAIEKSETASTALYKRASSPGFLHGHIQLADNDTLFKPYSKGAQMMLVKEDRKSTRLYSSHARISNAVFCLK